MDERTEKYFKDVEARANAGDSDARTCLAELYAYGLGGTRDLTATVKNLRMAAEAKNPEARLLLAEMQLDGNGVTRDPTQALATFHELFDAGYASAAVDIGLVYGAGNPEAGVAKDERIELDWFEKGAAKDDYRAETRLGLFYHFGYVVKKDEGEAQNWLAKAASHHIDCWADFGKLLPFLINGYYVYVDTKDDASGDLGMFFTYKDGRAQNVRLMGTSGNAAVDDAWLAATRNARLPPLPSGYPDDGNLGFWLGGPQNPAFTDFLNQMRLAIRESFNSEKYADIYRTKNPGVVTLAFDYQDGTTSGVIIDPGTGDKIVDAAIADAVLKTHYRATSPLLLGKPLHVTLMVDLRMETPPAPGATVAPASTTMH